MSTQSNYWGKIMAYPAKGKYEIPKKIVKKTWQVFPFWKGKKKIDYDKNTVYIQVDEWIEYSNRVFSCLREPETIEWLEKFEKGALYFDVGANVGAYALIVAKNDPNTKVYGFEPFPKNAEKFQINIKLNQLNNCFAKVYAIGAEKGIVNLKVNTKEHGAGSAEHSIQQNRTTSTISVDQISLDEFVKNGKMDYPNYIKIDTDGAEEAVLKGAEECLKHCTSLIIEFQDVEQKERIIKKIMENGFSKMKENKGMMLEFWK